MSGVGMIEGKKQITAKMISSQRYRANLEVTRLSDMINLAGPSTEDSIIYGEPAADLKESPVCWPSKSTQRQAPKGLRILFDDRDQTSEGIAGSPPASNLPLQTPDSNGLPQQDRSRLPWAARFLALVRRTLQEDLTVERIPHRNGCFFCGRMED